MTNCITIFFRPWLAHVRRDAGEPSLNIEDQGGTASITRFSGNGRIRRKRGTVLPAVVRITVPVPYHCQNMGETSPLTRLLGARSSLASKQHQLSVDLLHACISLWVKT